MTINRLLGAIFKAWAGGGKSRRLDQMRLVESSGLFDRDWYLETYPDIARAKVDPLAHYMGRGWREGRDPGPEFVTEAYLEANADVARTGVNPLLHFVEFGHSEGRATFGRRPLIHRKLASFDFAPPAPCASFPVVDEPAKAWIRASQLDPGEAGFVTIAGAPVGYAAEEGLRTALDQAFARTAFLSGVQTEHPAELARTSAERLADAWYVGETQLRTRWHGDPFPVVVRAYQLDPEQMGIAHLVGEGSVSQAADIVDFSLKNRFFPLLFVFSELDGTVRGFQSLEFPSLCRGGAHYPELLSLAAARSASGPVDPIVESQELAARLLHVLTGPTRPALGSIAVDLDGGDGTGLLFRRDFQQWLSQVGRVGVGPAAVSHPNVASDFLAGALAASPAPGARPAGAAVLTIGADMIPTISAVAEPASPAPGATDEIIAPLLSTEAASAQLAAQVELPAHGIAILKAFPAARIAKWPRLKAAGRGSVGGTFPPAAIRLSTRKDLTEAELFFPVGDAALSRPGDQRASLTWVIDAQGWEEPLLGQALHCLVLQGGSAEDSIALIGDASRLPLEAAKRLFPGRVRAFPNPRAAVRALETELAGYLGAGVLLHDSRSTALFAALLENRGVATASCILISTEKRGRGWRSSIVDGGAVAAAFGEAATPPHEAFPFKQLWRTNFPVRSPSADLWVARSSDLSDWVMASGPPEGFAGVHICSSLVTASFLGVAPGPRAEFIPDARDDQVTKIGALYG